MKKQDNPRLNLYPDRIDPLKFRCQISDCTEERIQEIAGYNFCLRHYGIYAPAYFKQSLEKATEKTQAIVTAYQTAYNARELSHKAQLAALTEQLTQQHAQEVQSLLDGFQVVIEDLSDPTRPNTPRLEDLQR